MLILILVIKGKYNICVRSHNAYVFKFWIFDNSQVVLSGFKLQFVGIKLGKFGSMNLIKTKK